MSGPNVRHCSAATLHTMVCVPGRMAPSYYRGSGLIVPPSHVGRVRGVYRGLRRSGVSVFDARMLLVSMLDVGSRSEYVSGPFELVAEVAA